MTYIRIIITIFCFIIYRPVGLCGELSTLNTEAVEHYQLAQYQQAEQLWLRASAIAEGVNQATIASNLGGLYRRTGQLAEAERCFRHCYELRRKVLGEGHTDTAIALNNVATIEITAGRYQNAEQDLRLALSASRLQSADRVSIETNLGNLLRMTGRLTEARGHLQTAFALADNNAPIQLVFGRIAQEAGNVELASLYYESALHVEPTPAAQTHLAQLRLTAGNFTEALRLLQDALTRKPSTEETVVILQTTAAIELAQDRLPQPAHALKQAIEIRERMLGAGHESLASLLTQYAHVLRKMGDSKEAKAVEQRGKWNSDQVPLRPGVSWSTLTESHQH